MENSQSIAAPGAPDAFPLSLDEFCQRLSAHDKRVELIGGFHVEMRKMHLTQATEAEFRSRFEAFSGRPA